MPWAITRVLRVGAHPYCCIVNTYLLLPLLYAHLHTHVLLVSRAQLKVKLPQLEASLFRNLAKHTSVDSSAWLSGDAPPTKEPLNEPLANSVKVLASSVADLSNQVRDMRDSLMLDTGVEEFSDKLGSEPAHALDAASASAESSSARKKRKVLSATDNTLNESENSGSSNGFGAQKVPDLCTSDMLKKLKANVDRLVSTTKDLRDDVPKCLSETNRELQAANQLFGSLSSDVDQAMKRPLIQSAAPSSDIRSDSADNQDNSTESTSIDNEDVSPKKAIRGIAAGSALRKRLAEEYGSSL